MICANCDRPCTEDESIEIGWNPERWCFECLCSECCAELPSDITGMCDACSKRCESKGDDFLEESC